MTLKIFALDISSIVKLKQKKYLINLLILKVISYTFNINFLVKSFDMWKDYEL